MATSKTSRERPAAHPGLLERLMATVQPRFRSDILTFEPSDPVFGGDPCRVPGCDRTGRTRGLCRYHYLQWNQHKPDLAEFIATADPIWRRYPAPSPCQVSGCRHGRRAKGICSPHYQRWINDGRPDVSEWITHARPVPVPPDEATCLISYCHLWVQSRGIFCYIHQAAWRRHNRPDVGEFVRRFDDETLLNRDRLDLRALSAQPRLEIQYVLQRRSEDGHAKVHPGETQRLINFVTASGVTSLLDWSEQQWKDFLPAPDRKSYASPLIYARNQIEDLAVGRGWHVEYPRDVWRLRKLDIHDPVAHVRFDQIPQPWLKELVKRWARWRLTSGLSAGIAARGARVLTRFALFLTAPPRSITGICDVDRPLLEQYLADLHHEYGGRKLHIEHIENLSGFLTALRQHGWADELPASGRIFATDYPKRGQRLPRALPEHVMAQVEHPDNLDRWDNPAHQLITVILIRCGLRVSDACRLRGDCIVHDAEGAPYLRYFNHKMKREALVPIDEQLREEITQQRERVRERWPGSQLLFPRPTRNLDGAHPTDSGSYRLGLRRWLEQCDVRDEHGHPIRIQPHQWRHTLGTRLINRDVPQHVVQKILDHESAEMTAHYARLADSTVRRHWESAMKVNVHGEQVTIDPDGPLAEASWAKQRIGRATQALPNGYCGLPVQQSCPHANACLTCPMFLTTPQFLPQHRQHRQQVLQIITVAEARGQIRLAEMNQQVADNLTKVITTLEADQSTHGGSADAV